MELRKIEIADVEKNKDNLKKLLEEVLKLEFVETKDKVNETYNNMKKFIKDNSAVIIGAFEDRKIIGFVWAYVIREKTYHVNYFSVDKKNRNTGIGQKLLDKLYEIAKKSDIEKIELLVEVSNKNAIRKYKNNGFKEKNIKMEKIIGG